MADDLTYGLRGFSDTVSPSLRKDFFQWVEATGNDLDELHKKVDKHFDNEVIAFYRKALLSTLAESGADLDEIAILLKCGTGMLSNWKSGRKSISLDTLVRAMSAFDVDLSSSIVPRGSLASLAALAEATTWFRREVIGDADCGDLPAHMLIAVWGAATPEFCIAARKHASVANVRKRDKLRGQINNLIHLIIHKRHELDFEDIWNAFREWVLPFACVASLITYEWRYRSKPFLVPIPKSENPFA